MEEVVRGGIVGSGDRKGDLMRRMGWAFWVILDELDFDLDLDLSLYDREMLRMLSRRVS
jgi:hypothetical protein